MLFLHTPALSQNIFVCACFYHTKKCHHSKHFPPRNKSMQQPTEIISLIFEYLPIQSAARSRRVCKQWNSFPILPKDEELIIEGPFLDDISLTSLMDYEYKSLKRLHLCRVALMPYHIDVILSSTISSNLTSLNLSHNQHLRDEGIDKLLSSERVAGLTSLKLSGCNIGRSGVISFIQNNHFISQLTHLDLSDNKIDEVSSGLLCLSSSLVANLKTLDLSKNHLSSNALVRVNEKFKGKIICFNNWKSKKAQ